MAVAVLPKLPRHLQRTTRMARIPGLEKTIQMEMAVMVARMQLHQVKSVKLQKRKFRQRQRSRRVKARQRSRSQMRNKTIRKKKSMILVKTMVLKMERSNLKRKR